MSRFGDFLRRATTTQLLRSMVADAALDGDCVCGIPVRAHRLADGRQVDCTEAARLFAADVFRRPSVVSMSAYRLGLEDRLAGGFCEVDSDECA